MGLDPITIGLALGAGGLNILNTRRTANRQDRQQAAIIRQRTARQREADARVGEETSRLQDSDISGERSLAQQQLGQIAGQQRARALEGLTRVGDVGNFNDAASQAALGIDERIGRLVEQLGTTDAAGLQRQREGIGIGRAGQDLGFIRRNAQGDDFTGNLRLANIRRSPFLDLIASGLQGAAFGRALGPGTPAAGGSGFSGPPLTGAEAFGQATPFQGFGSLNLGARTQFGRPPLFPGLGG